MAYWMKTSIFLTSFLSTKCSGSKPADLGGDLRGEAVTSNLVTRPTPLVPASSASQVASVPMPSDDTSPMPVMTTRLSTGAPDRQAYFLLLACASM